MNAQSTKNTSESGPMTDSGSVRTDLRSPRGLLQQQSFEDVIGSFLSSLLLLNEWQFYVNDKPMAAEILVSNRMMLPAILWQAEKTHQVLHGRPLGVEFKSDPTAAVGAQAVISPQPGQSKSLFPLYVLEVVCLALENFTLSGSDMVVSPLDVKENTLQGRRIPPRNTACSIDHLVQGFFLDHELGMVPWTADSNPRSPNLAGAPNA